MFGSQQQDMEEGHPLGPDQTRWANPVCLVQQM